MALTDTEIRDELDAQMAALIGAAYADNAEIRDAFKAKLGLAIGRTIANTVAKFAPAAWATFEVSAAGSISMVSSKGVSGGAIVGNYIEATLSRSLPNLGGSVHAELAGAPYVNETRGFVYSLTKVRLSLIDTPGGALGSWTDGTARRVGFLLTSV